MKKKARELMLIYQRLYDSFGPQSWWPADSPFEVIVGAILTQNTSWENVEKAIAKLKEDRLLTPEGLFNIEESLLAKAIRSSGYYNMKAKRLKSFISFLFGEFKGDLSIMFSEEVESLREKLLSVNGIGPETADSILLYAGHKPIFVIDAYTKRVFSRHNLVSANAGYYETQDFFMKNLPKDERLYNEYHALIVYLGKNYCKRKQNCLDCPVSSPDYFFDSQLKHRPGNNIEQDCSFLNRH
ncbi:MAG: endonuclease III domain-containing protein [Thermodesulfobacteriota bacterium]|nr:endonuclease III domain-containing protein [Thermodesulfobacteriota bacterium]